MPTFLLDVLEERKQTCGSEPLLIHLSTDQVPPLSFLGRPPLSVRPQGLVSCLQICTPGINGAMIVQRLRHMSLPVFLSSKAQPTFALDPAVQPCK